MEDILSNLTDAQKEAVTHVAGPALVVAGAGTGKTTVITRRIANLIQNEGITPERIVAMTFTDKAAREMEERLDILLPYGITGTTISTFHSFCGDILRRHAFLLGIDPLSSLMSTADEISFLRRNLEKLPTKLYKPSKNPVEFLRSLSWFMNKAKDECISADKLLSYAVSQQKAAKDEAEQEAADKLHELAAVYKVCEQLYKDESVLSYGDLIFQCYVLLKDFPSVRAEEQGRLDYLLIDEFQDTNSGQSQVAVLLTEQTRNIFVVGDDDQAIYSFRGANLANILEFKDLFPEAKVITLRDNFRSSQPILDAAYKLIQHNDPDRLEVREKISKHLISHSSEIVPPEHWHFERGIFEYQAIAEKISELVTSGAYAPEEIAVLIRAKGHKGGIETALLAQGIPSQYGGDIKFYNQPLIRDALSFLRFLADPHNDQNLFHLLANPPFSVPATTLQKYTVAARYLKTSLFEYLDELEELDPFVGRRIAYLKRQQEECAGHPPSHALLHYLHGSKLYNLLKENSDHTGLIASLHEEIVMFESIHPHATIQQYVEHIDYLIATEEDITLQQPPELNPEGVQIMTIHKSKGLEFSVVFILNVVQGRFPSRVQSDNLPFPYELAGTIAPKDAHIAEERRLAYVAMTRAKERLYLTSSDLYEDRKTKAKISPFIAEAFGNESAVTISPENKRDLPKPQKEKVRPEKPLMMPTSFSPSALDTYEQCPKRYEYQYVLKIKVPTSHFINFGNSIHETLKQWFAARNDGREINLEELYARCWIPGGYENKSHETERYTDGLAKIQKYIAQIPKDLTTIALEQSCSIFLDDGSKLSGKIDRVDQLPDGRVRVIDYKTGEHPSKLKDLVDDIPLGTYFMALTKAGKEVAEVELQYVMVGETVTVPASSMDIEAVKSQASTTISNIKESLESGEFIAKPDKFNCGYCEYRNICPFRFGN